MLFLGCLFKEEDEKKILELSNSGVSNAVNTFQWNLLNGLNNTTSIDIINILPVGTYPKHYKRLFLKTNKWMWKENKDNLEIGAINIPGLKQYLRYKKVKKEIKTRLSNSKRDSNIVIYSTYLPFLKAVYKLDRRVKITLIVTDLPEFYDLSKVGILRKILRKIYNYFIYKYLSRIDSFVLLTEQMKKPLKVGERQYIVVEGIADTENIDESNDNLFYKKSDTKIILYTGTLHYQYGIKSLLEAFMLIKNNDYELWICGSGEAEDEIKKLLFEDKRIKFFGFLAKDEVKKLQQKATVLVNPRPNEGEYTKYSFPSKTMEYMTSGKPVIMYKLDGIPDEYDEYLYYFNGTSPENIATKILEVCEQSEQELILFGQKAKHFVADNKNEIIQAKRILNMILKG